MPKSPLCTLVWLATLSALLISSPALAQLTIDIETAAADGYVGAQSSLKLDKLNRPHISHVRLYDDPALLYTTRNSNDEWVSEVVDVPGTQYGYFQHTTLALDGIGIPHISYYEAWDGDLLYANRRGGVWTTETVDAEGLVGIQASLALDRQGNPHIAYVDLDRVDLRYAKKQNGEWIRETIESEGLVGTYPSLALDRNGTPHISYYNLETRRLMYANHLNGSWNISVVTRHIDISGCTALSVGQDGFPRIAFRTAPDDGLAYAQLRPDGWTTEIVDIGNRETRNITMALDADGNPHVTFGDDLTDNVIYSTKMSDGWFVTEVNPEGEMAERLSVAMDSRNRMQPRFTFLSITDGDLCYGEGSLTPSSVEIDDFHTLPGLLVTPNPAPDGRVALRLTDGHAGSTAGGVRIFDAEGRLVRTLSSSPLALGQPVSWDGENELGRRVGAGVYLARLDGEKAARFIVVR